MNTFKFKGIWLDLIAHIRMVRASRKRRQHESQRVIIARCDTLMREIAHCPDIARRFHIQASRPSSYYT
jgi:hypothetical protein